MTTPLGETGTTASSTKELGIPRDDKVELLKEIIGLLHDQFQSRPRQISSAHRASMMRGLRVYHEERKRKDTAQFGSLEAARQARKQEHNKRYKSRLGQAQDQKPTDFASETKK
jgi:hypothetical protein